MNHGSNGLSPNVSTNGFQGASGWPRASSVRILIGVGPKSVNREWFGTRAKVIMRAVSSSSSPMLMPIRTGTQMYATNWDIFLTTAKDIQVSGREEKEETGKMIV